MKKIKKLLVMIMAMTMVLGLGLTASAAKTTYPDNVRVYGVEAEQGVTVNAYQIISYDTSGKYVPVLPGTITEIQGALNPSADDVLVLSGRTDELGDPVSLILKDDGYYAPATPLAAGTWMIIVEGSNNYIYNPAIVSVSVTADGTEYGELNLDVDNWGPDVWAKKSEPRITKTTLTPNVTGVQYGDILQFQIKAMIPSYAENKENITYKITDTLDGLALVVDAGHPVTAILGGVPDSTLTAAVNNSFINDATNVVEVILADGAGTNDQYIKSNGNKEIVITYFAKVTEEAKFTVNKLTNDAKLTYSTGTDTFAKSEKTEHYTFGIDTTFSGSTVTQDKTGEFIKIDDKGSVSYTENPGDVTVTGGEALSGAKFELHIGTTTGPLFSDASGKTQFETDSDGRLEIVGLDSDVDYYLVEVQAPKGYTINTTPVKVKINANFDNTTGKLTGYSVMIGEGATSATTNYNYKYETGETTVSDQVGNPYGFKNTKLSSLPSTGGIGTTIFTIGGCAIMIAAAALYFASKKKSEEN